MQATISTATTLLALLAKEAVSLPLIRREVERIAEIKVGLHKEETDDR
jgi:hypothetical protein